MTLAQHLTRYIDFFYIRPIRAVLPLQTFRYAVCGGLTKKQRQRPVCLSEHCVEGAVRRSL